MIVVWSNHDVPVPRYSCDATSSMSRATGSKPRSSGDTPGDGLRKVHLLEGHSWGDTPGETLLGTVFGKSTFLRPVSEVLTEMVDFPKTVPNYTAFLRDTPGETLLGE